MYSCFDVTLVGGVAGMKMVDGVARGGPALSRDA